MVGRFLLIAILLTGITLIAVEYEREYREYQSLRARQIYQKQILLDQQSRLRLELQRKTRPNR